MELCELAPSYVRAIAPYPPGKPISELAREMGLPVDEIVKLASNENPLGASPRVLAAIENAFMELARYPDGNGFALKYALAAKHGVALGQIVLGNGSNDVLEMAARAWLAPGTSAVYSQHAFAIYALVTQATGARGIEVLARDYGHDLAAMLAAIDESTRIVFIANPNNPTGTLLAAAEMEAFLDKAPSRVLVVLDEAYYEYLPEPLRCPSEDWLRRFPNLLVTRTFSKAYGLAGLRVGYGLAGEAVIDLLNRVRQPFNVNSLAQAAALAALADTVFLDHVLKINVAGLKQLESGLQRLGVDFIPSRGNFLCCRVSPTTSLEDKGNATAMYQNLLQQGVIVRPLGNYGMPEYLRVSVGLESENEQFLRALEQGLEEMK